VEQAGRGQRSRDSRGHEDSQAHTTDGSRRAGVAVGVRRIPGALPGQRVGYRAPFMSCVVPPEGAFRVRHQLRAAGAVELVRRGGQEAVPAPPSGA
jgi:hypothetical protein